MKKKLLWIVALVLIVAFIVFSPLEIAKEKIYKPHPPIYRAEASTNQVFTQSSTEPVDPLQISLQKEAPTLNVEVIHKVLSTLKCSEKNNVAHNNILTVIDYSLPSSEKRLWVFDLQNQKLLFNTYVSHGIKSGTLLSTSFSNVYDSKASSIGVYTAADTYYGRDGLSLRLNGLERGFNDNAFNRYVVMHGGWYVNEDFIKKYGRAGRSWGCPAVPLNLTASIINTIKGQSLFVVYYPSDRWLATSKFLNCENLALNQNTAAFSKTTDIKENESRDSILFADLNKNNRHEENEPILVISADNYKRIFQTQVPLGRMLRRQINAEEYIALSGSELDHMIGNPEHTKDLKTVYFVVPEIKMSRGYYETQMKIVAFGKIKEVKSSRLASNTIEAPVDSYTVYFDTRPLVRLKLSNQFIRWLGL
ncbi:MAG: murein L,D-transpeptidase catalytic domain family protein [Legionellaceae bacterium]|nr:murein L,D-transpeptidase catalytic domain family protein [Legionellaceae bacterium]